jgi:hypothetical protein
MKPSLSIIANIQIDGVNGVASVPGRQVGGTGKRTSVRSFAHPLYWVLLMFCCARTLVSQTAIIAARNSSEVVLAADSMRITQGHPGSSTVCKISSCGSFFVAKAGLVGIGGAVNFDSDALLRQACAAGGDSVAKIAAIERTIMPRYTQFLKETKRLDPSYYSSMVTTKELYLTIIMVGFEKGLPFIESQDFTTPVSFPDPITPTIVNNEFYGALPEDQVRYIGAFHSKGITEFTQTRNIWRLGLVEAVRFWVMYQIADDPSTVGPPIDILRITGKGAEWVQHKKECPEIQNTPPKPASQPSRPRRKRA